MDFSYTWPNLSWRWRPKALVEYQTVIITIYYSITTLLFSLSHFLFYHTSLSLGLVSSVLFGPSYRISSAHSLTKSTSRHHSLTHNYFHALSFSFIFPIYSFMHPLFNLTSPPPRNNIHPQCNSISFSSSCSSLSFLSHRLSSFRAKLRRSPLPLHAKPHSIPSSVDPFSLLSGHRRSVLTPTVSSLWSSAWNKLGECRSSSATTWPIISGGQWATRRPELWTTAGSCRSWMWTICRRFLGSWSQPSWWQMSWWSASELCLAGSSRISRPVTTGSWILGTRWWLHC